MGKDQNTTEARDSIYAVDVMCETPASAKDFLSEDLRHDERQWTVLRHAFSSSRTTNSIVKFFPQETKILYVSRTKPSLLIVTGTRAGVE